MTAEHRCPRLDRRAFVALVGLAAFGVARRADAQGVASIRRLGILSPHPAPAAEQRPRDFVMKTLRELGWIEGQNLVVENAYGEGQEERLSQLAESLATRGVDVIWAVGATAAVAAARATRTIPIVFWGVSAPVELGLVNRLARPGGNVTGTAWSSGAELFAKQLEFIKQSAPGTTRVAWITNPYAKSTVSGSLWSPSPQMLEEPARRLGIEVRRHALERPEDLDTALAAAQAWRAQAIVTSATPLSWRQRDRLADFARRHRILVTADMRDFVDAGALMSYAPEMRETVRRSLSYVDRILRGGRPADLPVEQPSRLQLAINLKTAEALGLTIPRPLLARADHIVR